jgi:hypothetical protein
MGKSLRAIREYLKQDFALYLKWTLDYQGLKVEKNQLEIANHLQYGGPAVGVMACRGASKTTIGSIHYTNWRHLRCPHLKVLILSGVESRAQDIARSNFNNYSNYPWLKHLAPKRGSSETAFNLAGVVNEPTRSVTSYSILGNFTGLRSDLLVIDDAQMEGQTSDDRYRQILDKANKATSLLRPPETRPATWFAAAPWYGKEIPAECPERTQKIIFGNYQDNYNDIYTPPDDPDAPHFMRGVTLRKWPAMVPDEKGVEVPGEQGRWVSSFPAILPMSQLLMRKTALSKQDWALQYMLDKSLVPAPEDAILNLKKISELAWDDSNEKAKGCTNWSIVIDPSDGKGDYFVAVVCACKWGVLWVRDVWAWTRKESDQCVYEVLKRAAAAKDIRRIWYESSFTGLGSVVKLVKEREGVRMPCEPFQSRENKLKRTTSCLEPALHSGQMRLHRSLLLKRDVRHQLENLRQGSMPKPNDDIVDCLGFAYRVFETQLPVTGVKGKVTSTLVA